LLARWAHYNIVIHEKASQGANYMSDMKIVSIQVGKVATHTTQEGETWTSGYYKQAIEGSVFVGKINLDGDAQHNTKVHGGEHRAILAYCADHYEQWHKELGVDLPYGSFGENLAVAGWHEDNACIGDIYRIGDSVRVQVSQPRQPCDNIYRHLGIRGIGKQVMQAMRTGWYLRVLETGTIEAGMSVILEERLHPTWTIREAHTAMNERGRKPQKAHELAKVQELEPKWRAKLAKAGS
jgi:MOSC domain-containing protein YiiM